MHGKRANMSLDIVSLLISEEMEYTLIKVTVEIPTSRSFCKWNEWCYLPFMSINAQVQKQIKKCAVKK